MPSFSSVRRTGRWDCSTRRIISSFSEAGYLIPRLPHPRSCFFKQAQFERLLSHDRLEFLRLTPQVLDLAIGRRPCRVARQTALASLQELLGPCVIKALGNAFTAAKLGDAGLAAQAVQNYPDLLFGRMALTGCPADVLHDPRRRRFRVHGFLSHLHSLMVTMSQKSSVSQAVKSVSQALMPDNGRHTLARVYALG